MPSSQPTLPAIRVVFFVLTVGGTLASVAISGVHARALLCGLAAGVLSAVAASVLSRFPATRGWLVIPVVMILSMAFSVARSGHSGAQLPLLFQFAGVALALYGAAIVFLRIGVLGNAQPVEP